MDSNELLGAIREIVKVRHDSIAYDVIPAINPKLARLIVLVDDLDQHLSTGGLLPVEWEPAHHATTDEMTRQEMEGNECEVCGRSDLATSVPPRCDRHVAQV